MNKKIIIPGLLCTLLVIVAIFTCMGGANKIKIVPAEEEYPTKLNEAKGSTKFNEKKDSIKLKVYVENSKSMDAYMLPGSNLKDAVFDYVSDLKRLSTSCSLYYINSQVIPFHGELNSYIKELTPGSFAKAGGNRDYTDLRQIIDTIVKSTDSTTVSIFVSDCILDIPQNATDFFGNCQVSIKNTFSEALSKNSNLGVEIIKLESKFEGYWYCGKNKLYLENIKRPYYIWVIGDYRYLADFNKQVHIENIIGGIKGYCAYTSSQSIPFKIEKETYSINHFGKINVELLVNLRGSLQSDKNYKNIENYQASHPSQDSVKSVQEIKDKLSDYSHVITLEISNPETLKSEVLTVTYPYIATWVSDSDDTTGKTEMKNIDKTTGLQALVKGIADAYKKSTTSEANNASITFGTISFKLINN